MGALGALPANAALEALVKQTPSGPLLFVNGQPTAPTMFFVNMDTAPNYREGQIRQAGLAGQQGVEIISIPAAFRWFAPDKQPDFAAMDERIQSILAVHPKAKILLRVGLSWPGENHSYERMVFSDGTTGTMPSIHCPAWRRDAAAYLTALVKHLEEKFPENMIGYHPCGQETAEWFYSQFWEGKTPGFEASALTAFRTWLKTRYATDDELRRAWRDDAATLGEAPVPTAGQCASVTTGGCFRDPALERKVSDFFAFQNEAMANVAAEFCRVVKEHAPRKLAVTFYGYSFELSAAPHGIQASGHLALRRILESPHVDALCGPVSYLNRLGGGGGYYMGPADSLALHGKLWLVEDDTRTYHAKTPSPEVAAVVDPNGSWKYLITRDARETRGVLSRNFAHFFTHGHAAWWMDLLGEGWYDDPEIWHQLGKLHAFYQQSMTRRQPYRPEIAVIMDEESNLDLSPSPVLINQLLGSNRSEWYRIGAPAGYWLMSDLVDGKVPPAKFYIMANAFRLSDAQLAAIKRHTPADSTILWTYAPGVIHDNRLDPQRVAQVTGMNVAVTGNGGDIIFGDQQKYQPGHGPLNPGFEIKDPDAVTLATFANGGAVAVAAKKQEGRTMAYSAVSKLPAALLHRIAREAGVHLYAAPGDVVMAGNGLVALHASGPGKKVIKLPLESVVEDLLTGEKFPAAAEFTFEMLTGDTRLLRLVPAQ
jgi:hypothetical protein